MDYKELVAQLRQCGPLEDLLPLEFSSGLRIDELQCRCVGCQKIAKAHGRTTWINRHVVKLETAAYCRSCDLWTGSVHFVYDDGRIVRQNRDGKLEARGSIATSWLKKFRQRLWYGFLAVWRM